MRGRGISFHGPANSAEAGGHRSKPEVVLAYIDKGTGLISQKCHKKGKPKRRWGRLVKWRGLLSTSLA